MDIPISNLISIRKDRDRHRVRAIFDDRIKIKKIIKEILKPSLCPVYIDHLIERISKKNMSREHLVILSTHLYTGSFVGRTSWSFNAYLKKYLKKGDSTKIDMMLDLIPKGKMWPEFFNNSLLSSLDKEVIEKIKKIEYHAMLNTLQTHINNIDTSFKRSLSNIPIEYPNISDELVSRMRQKHDEITTR